MSESLLLRKCQKFKKHIFTRRPPTNFFLHFTLTAGWLSLTTGLLTLKAFITASNEEEERVLDMKVENSIEKINDKFSRTEVVKNLSIISKYQRKLMEPPSFPFSLYYSDPKGEEWAKIWFDQRKVDNEEALDIDNIRKELRSLFNSVKVVYERNPKRESEFEEFLHQEPLNKEIVENFLNLVQPMDMQRCFHKKSCIWEKDAPHIYGWLKKMYKIN
eukprot:gene9774-2100_t